MDRRYSNAYAEWAAARSARPLVLRGARQVGKTWLIENLRRPTDKVVVTANFDRDPGLARAFASNDPKAIVGLLEVALRRSIEPGRTVLLLDEIQAAPELLAKLRWFGEEMPELHVVATGSLLDFALEQPEFSMPVGRVTYGHLEPLTFGEFLDAVGERRLGEAIGAATVTASLPPMLHARAAELQRTYMLVGGMPAAVVEWTQTGSLLTVATRHRDILTSMRDDFAKYRRRTEPRRIEKVFAALPRLVGRKFQATQVDREESGRGIKEAFRLLCLARVATPVRRSACTGIPLGATIDERYDKVCMLDVGLLATMSGLDAASLPPDGETLFSNRGQLAEQYVGQELRACRPFDQEPALFTWVRDARSSNAEVDYVIQVGGRVVPVEVKAGAPGRLRSLHMMVQERELDIAVRVGPEPLQLREVTTALPVGPARTFRLLSVPLAMVSEIPRLVREIAG